MSTEYKAKCNLSKARAQKYGEFLSRLAKSGPLTPKKIVNVARPQNSILHGWFEWNDGVAAEKYREAQAGHLLRIIVYAPAGGKPERAFLNVHVSNKSVFLPAVDVMSDAEMSQEVLQQALTYLRWFRRKYDGLKDLAQVYGAIDRVLEKVS